MPQFLEHKLEANSVLLTMKHLLMQQLVQVQLQQRNFQLYMLELVIR